MYSTPDVQYPDQQLESLIQAENDANLWLYNGDVGLVLYHYYRSRYQDDPQALATGLAILEKQIENAGAYLYNFKFAYGVPGLGWLIQFLINQGVLVDEEAEALHDIDDHIEKALHWNFSDNLYDLFIGTIGKGMYYLERLEFARQQQDHPTISELQRRLEAIVENLDHSAITHPDGVYWLDHYTSGHETHRPGHPYVGIGLSHGLPSIIYFLGRCYLLGIAGNTCLELIRRATDWLLQRESSPGHFPTKWYPDGEVDDSHDLSWCYGVFSAATAFYIAGKLLDDPVKTNKVATIIDHAAALSLTEYRVHESEGLKNIFFCHGTAGISYLFGKMHRLFGKSSWKTAADRWMAETRSVLRQYPQAKLRQHQRALLDGLAGVHLVLMAGEQEKPDTGWDRLFLLDLEQFA